MNIYITINDRQCWVIDFILNIAVKNRKEVEWLKTVIILIGTYDESKEHPDDWLNYWINDNEKSFRWKIITPNIAQE